MARRYSLAIVAIAITFLLAFGIYAASRAYTEESIRKALFEKQKQEQIEATRNLANHISSDLENILLRIEVVASKSSLQNSDLAGDDVATILREVDRDINQGTLTDGIVALNKDNIVVQSTKYPQLLGVDASFSDYIIDARETRKPGISGGLRGLNDIYGVGMAVPVISDNNGEYIGMVVAAIPTIEFFARYGNVLDIDASSIVAVDNKALVISTALPELLGQDFFGEQVQEFSGRNEQINDLYRNVLAGNPDSALFSASLGERFSSGYPIDVEGQHVMSVFITTPTAIIYSEIDDLLFAQQLQTILLWTAMASVVAVLIIYFGRQNTVLDRKVKQRTEQFEELNKDLQAANAQLRRYSETQKEFVHIAAHELRNPITLIVMMAEMLNGSKSNDPEVTLSRHDFDIIVRNAERLERLSLDILSIARIESDSYKLNIERFDLLEKIKNIVGDTKSSHNAKNSPEILYELPDEPILVDADKGRIFEVVANLLKNAIQFTPSGTITISAKVDGEHATVAVRDNGTGIDPEIEPRLFTKFASKSQGGTGLGLYVSKSIVEAHGGQISAENNKNGVGATFAFSLPLRHRRQVV